MLTVDEALRVVIERSHPRTPKMVDLADAVGLTLAEPIHADLNLPPFDKALMDGYALRSADFQGNAPFVFRQGERITAGDVPSRPLALGEAAVIMTGAPLPAGADCVIPHEKTTLGPDGSIVLSQAISAESSILRQGREMRVGERLFEPGIVLDAARIGVLAAVGKDRVLVVPRPRTVVVPTGDELVPIAKTPGPGQIRETNSAILQAMAGRFGPSLAMPIAPDHEEGLRASIEQALDNTPDVLMICGGVSAGQKDLVPQILEDLGFVTVFHKVKLKPGKPLLFAEPGRSMSAGSPLVFGLPGNPVSGLVGFLLFVRPVLERMMGREADDGLRRVELVLPIEHRGDRPTYHPARIVTDHAASVPKAEPLAWAGSADLMTVARSDGFLVLPAGDRSHESGEQVNFLPLPR